MEAVRQVRERVVVLEPGGWGSPVIRISSYQVVTHVLARDRQREVQVERGPWQEQQRRVHHLGLLVLLRLVVVGRG